MKQLPFKRKTKNYLDRGRCSHLPCSSLWR